jgi:gentisate 1,2-dioxygenase
MAAEPATQTDPMQVFYRDLAEKSMDALWRRPQAGDRPSEPIPPYQPARWRSDDILRFMERAGELVRPGPESQRRVIQLTNPSIGQGAAATHMLSGNVQMVLPGEVAPSHRHTNAAIRFIMKGTGAVTIVDGEPVAMNPGDLVLTPGWCYHGHISQADGPVLWMDSLDGPLVVGALRISRYQQYPDELEPATRPLGDSSSRFGPQMRPMWQRGTSPISPQFLYPWSQTEQALHDLARVDASPFDDVAFEYTNPTNGGHVLPTIGCCIQMIRPGVHTRAHRHANCGVFHVFRGRGFTVVDGVQIEWQEGDFFALPPWCWHEHANTSATEEAVLFHTNDVPVLESLNLFEEHEYSGASGHQTVTGTYEQRYGRSGAES